MQEEHLYTILDSILKKGDSLFSLNRETVPKEVMESQKQNIRLKDYDRFASWDLIQDRLKKEE